jgi:FtsP/CotA-like multicopper oxidase with cupredoxin domain
MNRRRFVVAGVSTAAVVGCSGSSIGSKFTGGSGPGGSAPSGDVHTLTAQYATRNISGYRIRTRTYDGMPFGPTIVARPGQMLNINIVNNLPPNPKENPPKAPVLIPDVKNSMEAMMPPGQMLHRRPRLSGTISHDNNPHGFNTTNLHVHGIQTIPHLFKPLGTSDPHAMMIEIEPGESFLYNFPIPEDHPSGLHWYHPHKHGSTDVQVSGGMAGAIIMRGPIDEVPEIAAAREVVAIVQSINVNQSKTDPTLYEREYVAYKSPDEGGYRYSTEFSMITVNGQGVNWITNAKESTYKPLAPPNVTMRPGEVIRLRLLNGTNGIPLALVLPGFECWQIGFDGVNLPEPKLKDMSGDATPVVDTKNLFTAPYRLAMEGNRIELLIQAPSKAGTYTLSSLPTEGIADGRIEQLDLMRFEVSGDPIEMSIPKTLPRPSREYPLVTDADVADPSHKKTFRFSQGSNHELLMGFGFTIDGKLYEMDTCPTTVVRGQCYEWTLENDTEDAHPFHLHMVSFQVEEVGGIAKPSEIWDTFIIPPQIDGKLGVLRIRMRMKQFFGKEVFHCHILPHEDTGMMQNFLVQES